MFLRWKRGRVYDLLLDSCNVNRIYFCGHQERRNILDQVKHGNSVTYWRQKAGTIGSEEQISLAVNSAQKIRELQTQKR